MAPTDACQTCKTRRVKCDRGIPTCLRCRKSRRECIRLDVPSWRIVSENSYADGAVKRPRGPRPNTIMKSIDDTANLHATELKYYFENHIVPPTSLEIDIYGSLSECIFAWEKSGNTSKVVDQAVLSMALAVYARKKSSVEAVTEAYKIYHELLGLLQEDVGRPVLDITSIDACLLTVFLMGRCEATMHNLGDHDKRARDRSIKGWSHHDGASALLKLWHTHFSSEGASKIVKQTRRGMLRSLLLRKRPVPEWLSDGRTFGERGHELEFDKMSVRLVNLRYTISDEQNLKQRTSRDELLSEVNELMNCLEAFANRLDESFSYQQVQTPSSDGFWFSTSSIYVCHRRTHSVLWAHLLATKMTITSTKISILHHDSEMAPELSQQSSVLQEAARDLAAIIPQSIGLVALKNDAIIVPRMEDIIPYYASAAVWPLTLVLSIRGYDTDLQQAFRSQIVKLGEVVGDGVLQTIEDWPSF